MKKFILSFLGALSAAAGALSQVPGIPHNTKLWSLSIAAVSGALFLFFWQAHKTPLPRLALSLTIALFLSLTVLGCSLAAFKARVASPAFGSLAVEVGGGSIGNRPAPPPTNPLPQFAEVQLDLTNTLPLAATNSPLVPALAH